jgi:hypothetical protein
MQQVAEMQGCRFIYGIVPADGKSIDDLMNQQAEKVAKRIVEQTSVQMMLEDQQLPADLKQKEVARLKSELLIDLPRDFWDE